MAKRLRVRDRLLFGLALMGDLLDRTVGQMTHDAYWMRRTFFWTPPDYKRQNYYQTVRRTLQTGYIEKVVKDGTPFLRLTTKGKKKIYRDFSFLSLQKRDWNGRWCLVIFDIEEKEKEIRDSLRYKLKELGFGQLQRSVYINPYDLLEDMVEFLSSHGILGRAYVLESKHRLMGDARKLASKAWKLKGLNKEYEVLFEKTKSLLAEKKFDELVQVKEEYLQLLTKDPFLPSQLLPLVWHGAKLHKLFRQIKL